MRLPPATAAAALGSALALAACARTYVEPPPPPRPATVQSVPGATIITPGTVPSTVILR